jgi:NDP-sugar pyrophosphorylase family protein
MLNIVIPLAGAGTRFLNAGYKDPKPLIQVRGKPMIRVGIENLRPTTKHRFIFIWQRQHVEEYGLQTNLANWAPGSEILVIDGLTEGAACTVLKAIHLINSSDQLMIANSDQYVDEDITSYIYSESKRDLDGIIMTMHADDPTWSYAELDQNDLVKRIVEKEVISNEATVGVYNFKHGEDFVYAAEEMIRLDMRVNNEFYAAPVYNMMIEKRRRIGVYNVGSAGDGMYGLGTPSDLEFFLENPTSQILLAK